MTRVRLRKRPPGYQRLTAEQLAFLEIAFTCENLSYREIQATFEERFHHRVSLARFSRLWGERFFVFAERKENSAVGLRDEIRFRVDHPCEVVITLRPSVPARKNGCQVKVLDAAPIPAPDALTSPPDDSAVKVAGQKYLTE